MNEHVKHWMMNLKVFIQSALLRATKSLMIIIFTGFCISASAAQVNVKLTLNNSTVAQAIDKLHQQTGYEFSYDAGILSEKVQDVSINVEDERIELVLSEIFGNSGINFRVVNNRVFLKHNKTTGTETSKAGNVAQQPATRRITGTVKDERGDPVIGATIVDKGNPSHGTVTDIDGQFTFNVSPDAVLEITYVGYQSQNVSTAGLSTINVVLREDTKALEELVVIGYGTRQRNRVTSAIDQVSTEMFENRASTTAMQALQGASPALVITQRNMNPNDNTMNINIRGVSSINDNSPLIVIDGLISESNTLNHLNPNDIENVSVLKDAGSAAIYGSRASAGVILVTTKRGQKKMTPVIRFNSQAGYQIPVILFRPVTGWENATLRNQAQMNSGMNPSFTPEQIRDLYNHRNEEVWPADQIFNDALQQQYNLSVTGGSDNTTYMVSAGYQGQESNFKGDFYNQHYNFRANLRSEFGKFVMSSTMAYNRRLEKTIAGGTGNSIIDVTRIPSYYYYNLKVDGKYMLNDVLTEQNPLAHMEAGGWENKTEDNIIASLNLEYAIIDGLKIRGLAGWDLTQHERYRRWIEVPLYVRTDMENPARTQNATRDSDDYNEKRYNLSTQLLLEFNRSFAEMHNVDALLGVSNESYTKRASQVRWRYTDPDLGMPTHEQSTQTGVAGDNQLSIQNTNLRSINSLFGRFGYNYNNLYHADFTFRYDGASRFDKDYRWGFFPSMSLMYRISEADYMSNYKANVGDLKVRTSYGILGNQNVGDYQYMTTYTSKINRYVFDNTAVSGVDFSFGNPELTWEKSATLNLGFDATFFKNSLSVAFDWFNRRTYDMLLAPVVPDVYGRGMSTENFGEMTNKGWETTINYRLTHGAFSHRFGFNLGDQKNKLVKFGPEHIGGGDQIYTIRREGLPLGAFFGYKTDGFYQSYEEIENGSRFAGDVLHPGDRKYVETKAEKTGIITAEDRVVLGNGFPRFTFGFNYDVTWKGIDFSIFAQGVGKRNEVVRGELMEPFHSNYSYNIYQHQLDFWTPTNPNAKYPRLVAPGSTSTTNNWGRASDSFVLNMAYIRVKNVRVGYTIPKNFTEKAGIGKLHIYVNAQNPLTFSKNSFIDPESSSMGSNAGGRTGVGSNSARNYPTLKYYGIGLDLEF